MNAARQSIVRGIYDGEAMFAELQKRMAALGCRTIKPTVERGE